MRLFFPNYEEIWGISIDDASKIVLKDNYEIDFKTDGASDQKIDKFLSLRRDIAKFYDKLLSATQYVLPFQNEDTKSSYHLYPIRVNFEKCKKTQKDIISKLADQNIIANLHYIPIYRQPFFEKLGFIEGYCPEAEAFHKETVSIPIYPDIKKHEIEKVVSLLIDLVK